MLAVLGFMAKRVRNRLSARSPRDVRASNTVAVDPRQLAMFLKEAVQGEAPAGPLFTLSEIWGWWKSIYLGALKSHATFSARMEHHVLPAMGELDAQTLTPEVVEATIAGLTKASAKREKPLSPQTVRHVRNTGRKVLNDAIRHGKWRGKNPFVGVKNLPKVPRHHRETLATWEAWRVLCMLEPRVRPIYALAIYLGMRKGEILALKQRDVRMDRRLLIVRRPKTGRDSELPIPDELVPFLEDALRRASGEFLFSRPDGRPLRADTKLELILRSALGRAGVVHGYDHKCRRCGRLEHHRDQNRRRCDRCNMLLWVSAVPRKLTFHGLRHVSSNLHRRAKCDPLVIRELLGHEVEGLAVTDTIYTTLDEAYMRQELNKLSLIQDPGPPSPPFDGGADDGGPIPDNPLRPPEPKVAGSTPASRASSLLTPCLLTVREVGVILRVSVATVRKLAASGRLPSVWVGQRLRFHARAVEAFMAAGGAR